MTRLGGIGFRLAPGRRTAVLPDFGAPFGGYNIGLCTSARDAGVSLDMPQSLRGQRLSPGVFTKARASAASQGFRPRVGVPNAQLPYRPLARPISRAVPAPRPSRPRRRTLGRARLSGLSARDRNRPIPATSTGKPLGRADPWVCPDDFLRRLGVRARVKPVARPSSPGFFLRSVQAVPSSTA